MTRLSANIGVEAGAPSDHAFVVLEELVPEPVDVHVVDPGEAPDLLPAAIGPAEQGMARQVAPAVAMGVDRQFGMAASSRMPTRPTEFRLAITQVPPRSRTRSWRQAISSSSPVRLKANITFRPLRSA